MKCQHRIRQSAERLLAGENPEPPCGEVPRPMAPPHSPNGLEVTMSARRNTTQNGSKGGRNMRKRNRTITIRCTDDEYERIHSKAQRHKMSLSNFVLRSALDKKIIVADGLDEVAKQQKAIGRNLNQIAMLAHEGRLHSVRLDELVEQHKAVTQAVCEIAKVVK